MFRKVDNQSPAYAGAERKAKMKSQTTEIIEDIDASFDRNWTGVNTSSYLGDRMRISKADLIKQINVFGNDDDSWAGWQVVKNNLIDPDGLMCFEDIMDI